jgi:hypothetical protein
LAEKVSSVEQAYLKDMFKKDPSKRICTTIVDFPIPHSIYFFSYEDSIKHKIEP